MDAIVEDICERLRRGEPIPEEYREVLFPSEKGEYELLYSGKMRREDVLADRDGTFAVPVQVERRYGKGDWENMIVFGDNLQFLKTVYKDTDRAVAGKVKGKVKLIYIDPPFATSDEFQNKAGAKAYSDKKKGSEFIEFLRRRLIVAREILAEDGSIFVHLDSKMSHYIKVILDEVFGKNRFRNEIVWCYTGPGSPNMRQFNRKHDTIFWYTKGEDWTFRGDAVRIASEVHQGGFNGEIGVGESADYESRGKIPEDWWEFAIAARSSADGVNRTGYPTEKPNKLLRRIIEATTDEGDLVMDFFAGSGSLAFVAEQLGRRWILCDAGKLSYFMAQTRLLKIAESRDLRDGNPYGKPAVPFFTASLGSYDLARALRADWETYCSFVSDLFRFDLKETYIAGVRFEGMRGQSPVKIFDFSSFGDALVDEAYIADIHAIAGRSLRGRVYIVAPANRVDFLSDYYEMNDVRYYFFKIPYRAIRELEAENFRAIRQPRGRAAINRFEECSGFHFVRKPEVRAELLRGRDGAYIALRSFQSQETESEKSVEEKEGQGFDLLSAVYLDEAYDGENFRITRALFADELNAGDEGLIVPLAGTPARVMAVYTDIYGNDFTEEYLADEAKDGRGA